MIRNESETLNVGMSKPPEVASRPAGGPGPRSKKIVSEMKKKYYLKLK